MTFTISFARITGALALGIIALGLFARPAGAQTVHWVDTLGYSKPGAIRVNLPSETSTSNKYWVDMNSGSGSTCSQSAPCKSLDNVIGKPGTTGGPAIIYLKGTGQLSWFEDQIYGSGDTDCRT